MKEDISKLYMRRRTEENGLKDKGEKTKSRRRKTLHYGSVPVYNLQQTNGCCGINAALGLWHIAAGH